MRNFFLPVFLFILNACQSTAVFEQYKEIPEETWNRYQVVEFSATIPDSGQYRVKVCVRHTTDYEMANLWCFVSTRSSAVRELRDTVNLKMAEPDGRWIGHGGAIKTVEQMLRQEPVTLPAGNVIFRIEQGMRQEDMKGVKNIGLVIEKVNITNE